MPPRPNEVDTAYYRSWKPLSLKTLVRTQHPSRRGNRHEDSEQPQVPRELPDAAKAPVRACSAAAGNHVYGTFGGLLTPGLPSPFGFAFWPGPPLPRKFACRRCVSVCT